MINFSKHKVRRWISIYCKIPSRSCTTLWVRSTWFLRFPRLLLLYSQKLQTKGFSPVWIIKCFLKLFLWSNVFLQIMQVNGLQFFRCVSCAGECVLSGAESVALPNDDSVVELGCKGGLSECHKYESSKLGSSRSCLHARLCFSCW